MPSLVVVIGANGAGKSTWCRNHRGELPAKFYDADSIAQGLGDYNDPERQREARQMVDEAIERHLGKKEDFGFESTYSGNSRPEVVRRAFEMGYTIDAVFVGTRSSNINIRRVAFRVSLRTGHDVPEQEIRRRWSAAQENLAKTASLMNTIMVLDNSLPDHEHLRGQSPPRAAREMMTITKGELTDVAEDTEPWVQDLWSAIQSGGVPSAEP